MYLVLGALSLVCLTEVERVSLREVTQCEVPKQRTKN
jgi:hypothetical protein